MAGNKFGDSETRRIVDVVRRVERMPQGTQAVPGKLPPIKYPVPYCVMLLADCEQWETVEATILLKVETQDSQIIDFTCAVLAGDETFTITIDGETTEPIELPATTEAVQAAIDALGAGPPPLWPPGAIRATGAVDRVIIELTGQYTGEGVITATGDSVVDADGEDVEPDIKPRASLIDSGQRVDVFSSIPHPPDKPVISAGSIGHTKWIWTFGHCIDAVECRTCLNDSY